MAERISMRNKNSGIQKDGFYGYSWTTLFFGPFVPLFRADFLTFLGYFAVVLVVGLITAGIGGFICFVIWSFFYNSYYTKNLLEKGYEFSDSKEKNDAASIALGLQISKPVPEKAKNTIDNSIVAKTTNPDIVGNLDDDAYKIYLVKKFEVEFNDVLKKHIFNQKLYDSIDDVIKAMHEAELKIIEISKEKNKKVKNNEDIQSISQAMTYLRSKNIEVKISDGKYSISNNGNSFVLLKDSDLIEYASSIL
jgi:hypothetical protein